MPAPETIPLGECTLSQSQEQLSPPLSPPLSRTESTVFSLSRGDSLWNTSQRTSSSSSSPSSPNASCSDVFWLPIHLMTTGGSFLVCGVVISGLYFAGQCRMVTNILGPALLSIGLMVFVVGVVLIPITKENRKQSLMKKPAAYYRPPAFSV